MFEDVLDSLADFFEGRRMLGVGLLVVVACALGFGVGYATVPVFKRTIAGQGEIAFTGDVEFVSVDVVDVDAVNVTVSVSKAGSFEATLNVGGVTYTEAGLTWGVGDYSVVFDGVVLPACPFVIRIVVYEV